MAFPRTAFSALVAAALVVAGCTTPMRDRPDTGARRDAPALDAPSSLDTAPAPDTTAEDSGALDAATFDAGTDAPVVDAPLDVRPDSPVGVCDGLFGSSPGYELCDETPTSCEFQVTSGTCRDACQSRGAKCSGAFSPAILESCVRGGATGCGSSVGDRICLCGL